MATQQQIIDGINHVAIAEAEINSIPVDLSLNPEVNKSLKKAYKHIQKLKQLLTMEIK
jgi:hypothetical protein